MGILARHSPARKTGTERFRVGTRNLDFTVLDFWRWANSDLLSNAARGVLAEFLVGQALGLTGEDDLRIEWDDHDLVTAGGLKIEVKSSAYLQSWDQKDYSQIRFDIAPKQRLDATTNAYSTAPERNADVYVFCLLAEKNPNKIDPLNLDQWRFWVVQSQTLNEQLGEQKTMGLTTLTRLAGPPAVYDSLEVLGVLRR